VKTQKDELLDHEADGIREFDNALPRWWLYGFYITILFAAAYLLNYHVLPRPLIGYRTVAAEYAADVQAATLAASAHGSKAAGAVVALTDPASLDAGQKIFEGSTNVCSSCHRPDLGGLVGPNLTDDNWLHGCKPEELVANVKHGFPEKGMLAFGTGAHLSDEQVLQVVSYVISKRGSNPANPKPTDAARDQPCK
jgi:cytochrome c oxidase cbb3-type subunit 3